MDFDWKSLVRTVAPSIASVFGTPLAGMAVKAVADAVLGPEEAKENPEKKLEAALATANPELLQKIKQADQDFKLKMGQLGIDLEKVAAEDRASARAREIAVRDRTPQILAFAYTLGYFALLFVVMFHDLPDAAHDLLNTLIGVLSAAQVGIMTYYFGSSAGSARKTELLGK
jgi:hypothetical protein